MVHADPAAPDVAGLVSDITFKMASGYVVGGISSFDAFTLASVPALFLVVALVASIGPALRAARVSPANVLRSD